MAREIESSFADCIYCGGAVQERAATREVRWQDKLFLIEDVPMGICGICVQCGERFLKPHVAKAIDKLLQRGGEVTRTVAVPVLTYSGA